MAQVCELTGKKPMSGNKVSHSNRKARTRWNLNLTKKRYTIPELKRTVTLTLTASAIRTIDKFGGISQALTRYSGAQLSDRLERLRRDLVAAKSGHKATAPQKEA